MSTVLGERSLPQAQRGRRIAWIAIAAGLAALYIPTYITLARTLWRDDDYAHGPIILAVVIWLAWRNREALSDSGRPAIAMGAASLIAGLCLYAVGRSQSLALLEVASHIPVIAGVLMLMGGPALLRRFAFALLILLFFIPLPGFILETVSTPLKEFISSVVAAILGFAGYPVEREGVVLLVGDHQMLMADACSGLNSLYSLTALTLLYTHLTGPSTKARWAVLLASVAPIAIAANVVRVLALVLVAYHFGDDAAQGFLHGFAGMLVFVTAFVLLIGVDKVIPARAVTPAQAGAQLDPRLRGDDTLRANIKWPAYLAGLAMLGAALATPLLKPVHAEGTALDLERLVPSAFGDWSIDPTVVPIAPTPDVQAKLDRIYSRTLSRAYVNSRGEQMMLTVAYGGDQSDALKAHRQEVCYTAQGFTIHALHAGSLAVAGRDVPVTRMLAVRGERSEPVTYWFTMGDRVVRGRLERLRVQLASGLAGRVPDGMLVRVSNISSDLPSAFEAQQAFIGALVAAMPASEAARFVGATGA